MRWQIGSDGTFLPVDIKSECLFFNKERILDVCEYTEGKMIVSDFFQSHLFIVHNWHVVHKLTDLNPKNISKRSFTLFPDFDPVKLPFILVSGESSINIVNVNKAHEDVLIKAKTSTCFAAAQTSCFFTTEKDEDITLHFTTTNDTEKKTMH